MKEMKKSISLVVFFIFLIMAFLPLTQIGLSEAGQVEANVTINVITTENNNEIILEYSIPTYNIETIILNRRPYQLYTLNDESNSLIKGFPDLPTVCRSIIIPDDKQMSVEILDIEFVEYNNINIVPSKGEISRIYNPDVIAYSFDRIYRQNVWYPQQNVELYNPYVMRDFRGQVVQINPIQYNPALHKTRVVSDISVKVYASGPGTINVIDREKPLEIIDKEFGNIYANHFMNYNEQVGSFDYTPVSDQGNMLVICYDAFYDEMLPFAEWKNMKGQYTEMVYLSDVGTTATEVDTYIDTYYNTNGVTFVLLVGDGGQVPTLSASGGESDVSYSYITSDYYSDLFIGRFSAESVDQVQTQVQRTIEYEKYPEASEDWYHKGLGVASNQGVGDEGEYDDEHMDNIRDKLLAYTYTEVEQSYDPWGTSTIIANAVNDGLSIINYCGHGSTTSWGNGGGFSNSNVNSLVNDNILPFITSVACVNGNFNGQTCFAEAWLRATNNGDPTGAVAHFASSINQDWSEPMDGQDEFNDILVESYEDNIKRTFGGLAFNGVMHMLDEYPSAGTDDASTWHIFGDPSVVVRTDTPTSMTVTHSNFITPIAVVFDVTVTGVEDALCALSYEGELLGAAYTDSSGDAIISLDLPIPAEAAELDLVVTAYNKIPYITTITVITDGPLLAYNPVSYNAGTHSQGDTDQTSFEIWNDNEDTLDYSLTESCSWVEVSPLTGDSTGEHDTITIDIDTTGLATGSHQCDIAISSNGGNETFSVYLYIVDGNENIYIDQDTFDRGFPIRYAADGAWGAAQSFTPNVDTLTRAEIYLRKFGTPSFDLEIEIRQYAIDGPLVDILTYSPATVGSSWDWFNIDLVDTSITLGTSYFIVIPPQTSNPGNSFGYEWGYAFGNQYDDGAFWFTRDGGGLWRDLPEVYEFCFKTYGYY